MLDLVLLDGPTLEKATAILDDLKCPFIINQNRYSIFDRTIENNGLKETAERLNIAKENGKRIISVGTTSTRTLESIYNKYGKFVECAENTNIFIYPPYEFKAIDSLITNFHLHGS